MYIKSFQDPPAPQWQVVQRINLKSQDPFPSTRHRHLSYEPRINGGFAKLDKVDSRCDGRMEQTLNHRPGKCTE